MRGVAVLLVVGFHCNAPFLQQGGAVGVDTFFVLSGFLITSLLRSEVEATGGISLLRFYGHRMLRLYPPLIMAATASVLLFGVTYNVPNVDRQAAFALLYLSDYDHAIRASWLPLSHTWSLAVEEHFYLVWPLVILATRSVRQDALARWMLAGFVACTLWRMTDYALWHDADWTFFRTDTRMAALVLGGWLGTSGWRPSNSGMTAVVSLSGLAFIACLPADFLFTRDTVIALLACGLIASVAGEERHLAWRFLTWHPIVRIGLLSYSIYLWHYPIIGAMPPVLGIYARLSIGLSMSIIVAAVSYNFIERPLKDWRHRRRAALAVA